ncbi:MAG TPA: hypothetical protein VGD27_01855 [Longimicrobiales bacterium]
MPHTPPHTKCNSANPPPGSATRAPLHWRIGVVAHEPLEIPGRGTFAIYLQGGNDHGLWQL